MEVLDIAQIKAWDKFTIIHEPISSLNLMERAATSCFNWLINNGYKDSTYAVICGKGNNGGDGLVLARLLSENSNTVTVYILQDEKMGTKDFESNLVRLQTTSTPIIILSDAKSFPSFPVGTVIIDAMYGSGLNRPLDGLSLLLVNHINKSGNEIISIDIPSGLFADKCSNGNIIIQANHTLSFQCYKLAFLVAENEQYVGKVHILDIGLHPGYLQTIVPGRLLINESMIRSFFKKRKLFAHKGHFGHAALLAGSSGMMGAAILSARACMHSGVGKLTCHVPANGITIMQLGIPEAMCVQEEGQDYSTTFTSPEKYDAIGIGPGLGRHESNTALLSNCFLTCKKPMVLDADVLFTLAIDTSLLKKIPAQTIITPHVGEFERLFGPAGNDFERMQATVQEAIDLQIIIILKGKFTLVATPEGKSYFNTTGNPGMAKAGNGDVLTGMILAFLAQGYSPTQAACLGVYLHGSAADIAVSGIAMEALLPSDTIDSIGAAIKKIS